MSRVVMIPEAGCWIYMGSLSNGYGKIWDGVRSPAGNPVPSFTHRVTHEHFIGPIPDGVEPDHLCRVTSCCNPYHLELVSHQVNLQRAVRPDVNPGAEFHKAKTHCPQGHPYNEANTGWWRNGRVCKTCKMLRARELRRIERESRTARY